MTHRPAPAKTCVLLLLALLLLTPTSARAQDVPATAAPTTRPADSGDAQSLAEISKLRDELVDAYNKRDIDRLLSHLHPDVVVTWQNAEVSLGREGVRKYYERMMVGPDSVVLDLKSNPVVEGRTVYGGNMSISYGHMNDEFKLREGLEFKPDSRFSAALVKEDGKWLVKGFHASGDMFDNPITHIAARRAATFAGAIAGVMGIVLGFLLGRVTGRRRAGAAPAGATGTGTTSTNPTR